MLEFSIENSMCSTFDGNNITSVLDVNTFSIEVSKCTRQIVDLKCDSIFSIILETTIR